VSARFTAPTAALVDGISDAGQVTFEVSTKWAGWHDNASVSGSDGYQPSTTEYLIYGLSGGTSTYFWVSSGAGGLMNVMMGPNADQRWSYVYSALDGKVENTYPSGAAVSNTANRISTGGKDPDFVTVQIGWGAGRYGGWAIIAVDGLIQNGLQRTFHVSSTDTFFQALQIGGNSGNNTFAAAATEPLYIRNLQISTEQPRIDNHPLLRHVYVLSDSIFDAGYQSGLMADNMCGLAFRRRINQENLQLGDLTIDENGGYTVSTLGTQLISKIATLLAANPSVAVINGGTNDLNNPLWPSDFEAEYLDLLEQIFFTVAKTGRSTVEYVICNGPPPRDSVNFAVDLKETAQTECIQAIKDVIALWDSTYASYAGKVIYHDVLNGLGGNNGKTGVSLDGVHLDYLGTNALGYLTASKILNSIG